LMYYSSNAKMYSWSALAEICILQMLSSRNCICLT